MHARCACELALLALRFELSGPYLSVKDGGQLSRIKNPVCMQNGKVDCRLGERELSLEWQVDYFKELGSEKAKPMTILSS